MSYHSSKIILLSSVSFGVRTIGISCGGCVAGCVDCCCRCGLFGFDNGGLLSCGCLEGALECCDAVVDVVLVCGRDPAAVERPSVTDCGAVGCCVTACIVSVGCSCGGGCLGPVRGPIGWRLCVGGSSCCSSVMVFVSCCVARS